MDKNDTLEKALAKVDEFVETYTGKDVIINGIHRSYGIRIMHGGHKWRQNRQLLRGAFSFESRGKFASLGPNNKCEKVPNFDAPYVDRECS